VLPLKGRFNMKVEVSSDEIHRIIREDLIDSYKENLDDPFSPEILDALEVVLEYYSSPSEYSEWFKNRGRDER
jgi:hypothetical protein